MSDCHYTRLCVTTHRPRARLDKFLAALLTDYSRVQLQALITDGGVLVNNIPSRPAAILKHGDEIAVALDAIPAQGDDACAAEDIALNIIAEDDALLVLNKPAGIVVHPGHGNSAGTLQAAILHHHPDAATLPRGGLPHRLDKDTSGILVAGKTARAQKFLISLFKKRQIKREYLALVHGEPPATGVINLPIGRHRNQPTRMTIRNDGKPSVTRFNVLRRWHGFALLRCLLETGRTHQIRVHLEHRGYPIVGDKIYKRRARPVPFPAPRQLLHARKLTLLHPETGEPREWQAPVPADISAAQEFLDRKNNGNNG